jgi:hypothetical protein
MSTRDVGSNLDSSARKDENLVPLELTQVWGKLAELMTDVVAHPGFGEIHIAVRWLNKGRKEIILSCGKEYRFVVDARAAKAALGTGNGHEQKS